MRLIKNGTIILIIGILGVLAIIGAEFYVQFFDNQKSYSAQEIAQMDIQPVNINTATFEELAASPKMTPNLAQKIINHREEFGNFSRIEDLLNVKGIGKKTYTRIAIYLTAE